MVGLVVGLPKVDFQVPVKVCIMNVYSFPKVVPARKSNMCQKSKTNL